MIKKNIPNLFTLCNLLCGCIAIVLAFQGYLEWSACLAGIACVLDFLDGMMARILNVHSEIGKQLDSLADMVSFGVVPGVFMFMFIRSGLLFENMEPVVLWEGAAYFFSNYFLLPLTGFSVTIFSAIRLAKFNLDSRQADSFIGLPTPANAIFIITLFFSFEGMKAWPFYDLLKNEVIFNSYFYVTLSFILSFLLIAPLPLFALKFKNFSWADNKVRYIFLALALALLIIFKVVGVPLIIVLYIVLSVINNLFSKKAVS